MNWQHLGSQTETRDFALIFETGDDVMEGLERFARQHDIRAASLSAIGAFQNARLAYFSWASKEYEPLAVDEQVEVVSLSGNLGREEGDVRVHLHGVLGRRYGSVIAGHLQDAVVRPTLEVFVRSHAAVLERVQDEESGLALIRSSDGAG